MAESISQSRDVEVSVIIPAHNAEATIDAQLEALHGSSTGRTLEIIAVANRCTDRTIERIARWQQLMPELRVVEANDRPGASHARNVGAATASGELLLFCDADDVVDESWVDEMCDALTRADLVGGRLEPMSDTDQQILHLFPTYESQQRNGLVISHTVMYAMTASMGCRRETFAAFGGFDDRMTYGSDDVVASLRAQQAGFRIGFAETAVCNYRIRSDLAQVTRQRQAFARSNVLYEHLYYPAASRPVSFEIFQLGVVVGRWALAAPTHSRRKWTMHARAQSERLRTALTLRRQAIGPPHPDWDTRPGFFVTVGRLYPRLRRMPTIRRSTRAWAMKQPLVDYTVPPATPVIGGLALRAPYAVARMRPKATEVDCLLRWAVARVPTGGKTIHIGDHAVELCAAVAMTVGRTGSVVVVEPLPQLAEACRQNADRHFRETPLTIVQAAAGRRDRVGVDLSTEVDEEGVVRIATGDRGAGHVRVPMRRLDTLVEGRCDLMSVAVGGAELDVLAGARTLLSKNPHMRLLMMVIPSHPQAGDVGSITDLIKLLAAHGIVSELRPDRDDPPRVDHEELANWWHHAAGSATNQRRWLSVDPRPT